MAQKKKDRQDNGPKEERQTIQWPKRRKTDNTRVQKKKEDKTMVHISQETTIAQQKFQYKTEDKLRSPEMY